MSIKVNVYGGNADFCTDYGTSPVGTGCHIPLSKMVWGDKTSSYRVNETTPMPVQVMAVTGESLVISGNVGASGSLPIVNYEVIGASANTFHYLAVAGSTTGAPIEITIGNSGDAINVNLVNAGVTFSVNIGATVGVVNGDSGLVIQGLSGGEPIAVKGRNGEAIEVTNSPSTAISVTGDFFIDGTQVTTVSEITKPSSIVSGSLVANAGSASQLPSNSLKTGLTVKSHPSNVDFIYIGNSGLSGGATANAYILESGESLFLECNNSNLIYVMGISGDARRVNYIGS